jgi:hypothetical protein
MDVAVVHVGQVSNQARDGMALGPQETLYLGDQIVV